MTVRSCIIICFFLFIFIRVLASYSYDGDETPLRSDRIAEKPPMSDFASDLESVSVCDSRKISLPTPFTKISEVPGHDEFIQIVINAKTTADITNSPTKIEWRGYCSDINPGFILSKESLTKELLQALKRLNEVSETEKKVLKIKYNFIFPKKFKCIFPQPIFILI